jgi:hypothetical protein
MEDRGPSFDSKHNNVIPISMNFHFPSSRKLLSAVVGSIISLGSALAATVPAPKSGDIFIGFRSTVESQSYLINIGQDSIYRQASGPLTLTALGNIGADLTARYGASWHTRSDLHWGIFGLIGGNSPVLYASRERIPVTSNSVPWSGLDLFGRTTTSSQITSVLTSYRSLTATVNSPVAAFQQNAAQASSYNYQVATPGGNDFGSLSEWASIEGGFKDSAAETALDLYRIGVSAARVGSFTISSAGVIRFSPPVTTPPVEVDTDGDGFLDSQEALAGTSPTDATDFFRVQSLQLSSGGVGLSFRTIPGSSYQIYYSQDLSAGSWELIHTEPGGANPVVFQYNDGSSERRARAKGFYKVAVTR